MPEIMPKGNKRIPYDSALGVNFTTSLLADMLLICTLILNFI